jgi:hypothetical protein
MCRKLSLLLLIIPLLFSCKSKKLSLNENPGAGINDFLDAFPTVALPFEINNEMLQNDQNDSFYVNYKTFTRFFPDSVLVRHFGKSARPKIYLLAKIQAAKNEYYLFFNAIEPEKKIAFVSCYTKEKKFSAARVLYAAQEPGSQADASLDTKYTITVNHQHKNQAGELIHKKDVYIYNDVGKFMLILTESNEPKEKNIALINPIDTLPRKHAFSGDYFQDKNNLVSIRDYLRESSRFTFFVHFEKDNGDCKGELKGTAKFVSAAVAQYHSNNDPCGIQFSFADNSVYIREISACGSHRDIKCFFEGSYRKKKDVKKKQYKKPKKDFAFR